MTDYLLGEATEDERRELIESAASSPQLATEIAALEEAIAMHVETLQPVAPSAAARERLLAALAGVDRFRPFLPDLSRMLDLPEHAVREMLERIDTPTAWNLAPVPGVQIMHIEGGPATSAMDVGLVRIAAGSTFPRHKHLGTEKTFILEGTLCEQDQAYRPGQLMERDAGSAHSFRAGPERELLCVVIYQGIELVVPS